ncbi:MAG: Gfo/Idh/MocA family oxidoreductase [Bacteroidota bacterium]
MGTNRRDFIKVAGVASAGMITGSLHSCNTEEMPLAHIKKNAEKPHKQIFNMCGYAAPPLKTVRIGFIGLGHRGPGSLRRLCLIEGVEIKALCDIRPDRVELGQKIVADSGMPPAREYGKDEDDWKKMCESDDIDLIYQVTPWRLHTPVSVFAMDHDKHAAVEMPAALTIEDNWKLVETSERTRKHCMMLENCVYDFFEMLTLNMVRQGLFGEIIHADAAYIHDQVEIAFKKNNYPGMWLLKESQTRNGNHYPTHGLGPVCQVMDINRGDRLQNLVSMQSNDFTYGPKAADLAKKDSFYEEYDTHSYRGNMNTSIIRTALGKTIMLQHDVSSPRPYSRKYTVSGTKATAQKWPLPPRISLGEEHWIGEEEMKELEEKYTPAIVKKIGKLAKQVGGHGGMDFMMDWRLIDCLRNGLPLDQDVYDAAAWSSIVALTEWSVANGSQPIEVPDFTCGAYKNNTPVDVEMKGGGSTGVRVELIKKEEHKGQQTVEH